MITKSGVPNLKRGILLKGSESLKFVRGYQTEIGHNKSLRIYIDVNRILCIHI